MIEQLRRPNEAGLKSYSHAKKCMLNEQRKRTRFLWGQYHSKNSVKEWSTIFFTDESTFNINNWSVQYVTRRIGERYDKKCVVGAPVQFWGGFSKDSLSPLVRIQGRLDAPTFMTC